MPTPAPDPDARIAEMVPMAQAAAEVGVKHIVYPGATEVEGLDFPLLSSHTRVYEAIVATGVQATHLRVNIYAEVAAGELAAPVDGARVAPVLRSDIAPAIAAVLTEDGHEGTVYDLTGQDAVSWEQLAELASRRAGAPIRLPRDRRHRGRRAHGSGRDSGAVHPVHARALRRLPRRLVR